MSRYLTLLVGYTQAQDENVLKQHSMVHGDGHAQRELASYLFGRKGYRSALSFAKTRSRSSRAA
jgi:hypothetical protein